MKIKNIPELKIALNQALIPMILVVVIPSTFLGFVVSGSSDLIGLIFGIWIIATMDMGGNALNNFIDWGIDERNKKRLELHRILDKKELLYLSFFLFLCSVPFLFFGNYYLKAVILVGYLVAIGYSVWLKAKDRIILNYLNIALFYGPFAFLYGYFASTGDITNLMENIWMLIFLFLVDMGFSVTKDYEDVEGDKALNKITMPVRFGKGNSLRYQFVVITLAFLLVVFLSFVKLINVLYLVVLPCYFVALYCLGKVKDTEDKKRYHLAHNIIRVNALASRLIIAMVSCVLRTKII
ncbi:MAG: UbiA family prenyltransferase [Candidatus Micrarchaeota archaeon]